MSSRPISAWHAAPLNSPQPSPAGCYYRWLTRTPVPTLHPAGCVRNPSPTHYVRVSRRRGRDCQNHGRQWLFGACTASGGPVLGIPIRLRRVLTKPFRYRSTSLAAPPRPRSHHCRDPQHCRRCRGCDSFMTIAANSVEITQQIEWISTEQWRDSLASAHRQGWVCLDVLTAIDRPEQHEFPRRTARQSSGFSARAVVGSGCAPARCRTGVPSLMFSRAAAWHERETREMFGITFTGNVVST